MKNATEIRLILDRSGSMHTIKSDVIGGFNSFLEEQQALEGECHIQIVQFSDFVSPGPRYPIRECPRLSETTYKPAGMTSLLDAIGSTVNELGSTLRDLPENERPDKVLVVVITDGQENYSKDFTSRSQIKEMVEHQTGKYSWKFLFVGANVDAFSEGNSLGIAQTAQFTASSIGTRSVYRTIGSTVSGLRKSGSIDTDWNKDIK